MRGGLLRLFGPGVRVRFIRFADAVAQIDAAWSRGRPFALVRIGDAESSLIAWPRYTTAERMRLVLERALEDRAFSVDEIAEIRTGVIRAMREADLVGVYGASEHNPVAAVAAPHLAYAGIRRLTAVSPAIHLALQCHGELARMIGRADRVTLVSGREVLDRFRARFPRQTVDQIRIRPDREYRLAEDLPRNPTPHFPDGYREVMAALRPEGPHHLHLVGAGFLGKAYCTTVQQRGGFALDIGSVFDYWSQVPTREFFRTVVGGTLRFAGRGRFPGIYLEDQPAAEAFAARYPEPAVEELRQDFLGDGVFR